MSSFTNTALEARRTGKSPEKSTFSQTCTLLSQFLKEKRASVDSTLGVGAKVDPRACTKDFLGSMQNSDGALSLNTSAMDSLPQLVENPCIKKSSSSPGPESPQLTIFYAGKMLVFDAFPPEKATEVMEMATKLASDSFPSDPVITEKLAVSDVPPKSTSSDTPKLGNQGFGSDMRYPRRNSLVKFLEKRKERVNARGPYQINNQKSEGSSSGGEPENHCSKHFDLNL
ncbi:hypothetical protein Fmac_010857 [Flemingia macrophylla]|uniref:Protein TIFY n=1 Tax=Flemingia macrophylla TaxID=520843 RepID=A0ABD1MKS4_9FABA